ncbi:TonB-dependent receptor [Caulobacter vibrioides]|uniref:TonB-dependent siderophore receptor n=1 Tax=Caulobacter vibrioides TaxID=155892 RepID=UPI000BB51512|nr:TonB-dependent receptor [Caulobacter vibrioides]ATC24078.1 TonB-dependent receptor [Caulobacter vibrioides]AZH12326.1 TonB-dependent receptor [Caulobacter vibrioides]PLR08488.1 TonB-dependent receptor [Caulobacter vibrioides]
MNRQKSRLLVGAAVLAMLPLAAHAQQSVTKNDQDVLELDAVVITASRDGATKMNSSISVSALSADQILAQAPRSTAEIFRGLPGVRSEATGGDGNANIAVRGLPVASGGAKFLQLQEDGLPVMEFGDIAFGNADIFLRADQNVARIESVRGGSSSTFASNSPGGVINFISKTGEVEGGEIALTKGLGYDHTRLDFDYGAPLSDTLRFHVGGFYREGEGARKSGYTSEKGGQIKANLTKDFENGFIRLNVKYLNDRAVGYLPMPTRVTGSNGDPDIGSFAGYDIGRDDLQSIYLARNPGLDGDGNRRISKVADGMHPDTLQFGAEAKFDIGGWKIEDRFKVAKTSGRFVAPFPAEVLSAQALATSIGGAGATLRYANGPSAGQAITAPGGLNGNGLAMRIHMFDVEINDFGNAMNDLKLSRSFDTGAAVVDVTVGYYKSRQTIAMDWLWNTFVSEVKGDNAALLDVYNSAGTKLTQTGLAAYGVPLWGNCCTRRYDVTYDIDAPYLSLSSRIGDLSLDASLRRDEGKARGLYAGAKQAAVDVNGDGVIQNVEQSVSVIDNANASPVNYDWGYTSWSLGANYQFNPDVAAFARVSRGGRANADRLLFGKVRADGTVSKEDAVDMVDQVEGGVKYRRAGFGLFATAFWARTQEQNFEATSQRFFDRTYKAKGIELEASYRIGDFSVTGGATYTDAVIDKDALTPAVVGNAPRRQAKWIYQFAPTWTINDKATIGASVIGTTKAYAQDDNQLIFPAYAQVNAFAEYKLAETLSLSVNANNLFDKVGLTEAEEGSITAGSVNAIRARSINGRTVTATLRYSF